ncbi:MAG: HAMP domain-containing protein [Chloroflexi bacterium]|nr:HAMP domain-containing protein [Chloroflexota bacterium]
MLPGGLNRLGVQITLTATVLVLAVGGLVVWQVDGIIQANERERARERLLLTREQVEQQFTTYRDLAVTGASVLATQPEMRAAIEARDVAEVLRVATHFFSQTGAPLQGAPGLQIYDPSGALLIRAHTPLNGRQEFIPPAIRAVLRDRSALGVLRNDEVLGIAISGIVPVTDGAGRVVGVIEALTGLDRRFVRDQARLLGVEVAVVLWDGQVIASDGAGTLLAGSITSNVRAASAMGQMSTVQHGNVPYLAMVLPLTGPDGGPLAELYFALDRQVVDSAVSSVRMRALRATLGGALLASALVIIFATLIVRPLRSLLDSAIAIRSNELERPVPQTGPQEVREIAAAMDDMRLAIRQSREVALSVNRDLASRFDASAASLSDATQELRVMYRVLAALNGETPGGLASVAEFLSDLAWVDSAVIGLATEQGRLSFAAASGVPVMAAHQLLGIVEGGVLGQRLEDGFIVSSTAAVPETQLLPGAGIGGFVAHPMSQPDGVVGVVALASRGPIAVTRERTALLGTIAREVTAMLERTELADEVEESRRIAESVLREMADGVLVFDHEARCRVCNPAAARLLNRTREALIGQAAEDCLPLSAESIEALRRRAYQPHDGPVSPLLTEVRGRRLAVSSGPFADPDPDRSGMLVLIRDLSAESEAEQVKQDFVSMVGHELRTPLTLIRTTIDLLHEGDAGTLNPTQQRIVEVLLGNTDRLMALITDILDVSAIDSGRLDILPEYMDIGEAIRAAVEEAMPGASAKQHTLFTAAPLGITVWADQRRIVQVLANLLSNAVKYTPPGGRIEAGLDTADEQIRIWVRDSGIGIPEEEQERLFEKFYRTSSGRRITGGTGLGLSIARSLVEMHGGRIWCDSDGETGSTFAFTLPRRRV